MGYDKVIMSFEVSTRTIYDNQGGYIGIVGENIEVEKYNPIETSKLECVVEETKQFTEADTVVELVKLGVTPDELVKLKRSDLI